MTETASQSASSDHRAGRAKFEARETLDPPRYIAVEPKVGPYIVELSDAGAFLGSVEINSGDSFDRTAFFCSDSIDLALAKFGGHFTDPDYRTYTAPPTQAWHIGRAVLIGSDGVVLHNGEALRDTVNHLPYWEPTSLVADCRPREYFRLRQPIPIARKMDTGPCFVGFVGAWRNYAHWMHEVLPRLFAFCILRLRMPALKLVLPYFPTESFQQQTLNLLQIGSDTILRIADDEAVEIVETWILSSIDLWSVPSTCRQAADYILKAARMDKVALTDRIYIHRRGDVRQVINFPAVRQLIERHGFRVVIFEALSLRDQIATMRQAQLVICEHGAGLANIIFCQPGAQILELFNPVCVQPAFWTVASRFSLGFGFLVGSHVSTAYRPAPDWNAAYDVPLDRLENAIVTMIHAAEPAPTAAILAKKSLAVVTMVYNEADFLPMWVRHYAQQVGAANCYVIDHGSDDGSTRNLGEVNVIKIPRSPMDEQRRCAFLSEFCNAMLKWHDWVGYTDSDEFLVADPARFASLRDLCSTTDADVVTAIGFNVVDTLPHAGDYDSDRPVLQQRPWGYLHASMSKPALTRRPIQWAPGFHSYDGPPVFDGLFNFHLQMFDQAVALRRQAKRRTVSWNVALADSHPHRVDDDVVRREIFRLSELKSSEVVTLDQTCPRLRRFLNRIRLSAHGRESETYRIDMEVVDRELRRISSRFADSI